MTPPCSALDENKQPKYARLFDSRWPADHERAKKICAGCPMRLECKGELETTMRMFPGAAQGTWAGVHINPKGRVGRPPAKDAA